VILNFIYLMLTHPKVQEKAQEELDAVISRHRVPDFSDRESLPYVNAIVNEVLRWYPNAPLGAPHATTEEDDYKGMRIPKRSLILTNIW
jgi:cytochrome P450